MKEFDRDLRPEDSLDPLKQYYHELVDDSSVQRKNDLEHLEVALLIIDIQYLDAARGYGVFKDVATSGIPVEQQEYYFDTLNSYVLPNVQRLLKTFRDKKIEVIHTRIQAMTQDGRDRSNGHKRLGLLAAPGSKEADFLPEVAPQGDEIVVNKTASGVFSSTNLNYILQNLRVNELIVAGVYTNECVETTIRDACDLGYLVTMVEDACTTVTPELQQGTINSLKNRYASVLTTDEIVNRFKGVEKQDVNPDALSLNKGIIL
ncbi:cysteine hydrolase family protein [Reichenbachiella sp. MSK19-1]|uniref:cysteine hydrolase family protein n=1 Tax=Reichenbachiella sp. MSK19-1 TaxID=1897631 RepID=UPI000E6C1C91|nr:isochorismatase family cysteine hydrolase [Reichenbachiella sp. MSK19-1]RJE74903.1 N-carbamoylsarcosine amidase [Reichenbachiella sp. MSK19-1]